MHRIIFVWFSLCVHFLVEQTALDFVYQFVLLYCSTHLSISHKQKHREFLFCHCMSYSCAICLDILCPMCLRCTFYFSPFYFYLCFICCRHGFLCILFVVPTNGRKLLLTLFVLCGETIAQNLPNLNSVSLFFLA